MDFIGQSPSGPITSIWRRNMGLRWAYICMVILCLWYIVDHGRGVMHVWPIDLKYILKVTEIQNSLLHCLHIEAHTSILYSHSLCVQCTSWLAANGSEITCRYTWAQPVNDRICIVFASGLTFLLHVSLSAKNLHLIWKKLRVAIRVVI